MVEEIKRWRSKCTFLNGNSCELLAARLTEFAKDKFVIAWQIFSPNEGTLWGAFVTYKVQDGN